MSARPRDLALERELTDIAVRAAGFTDDGGLGRFADSRALPGPVQQARNFRLEALEEVADQRNYCLWGIEAIYHLVLAGDPDALEEYRMLMGGLQGAIYSWHRLHGR